MEDREPHVSHNVYLCQPLEIEKEVDVKSYCFTGWEGKIIFEYKYDYKLFYIIF